jgi:hypothetical protein
MSFRNGDKARSGRLRKQRNANRVKTRALRAALHPEPTDSAAPDTVATKTARKIGSVIGTIAAVTHLAE